MDNRSYRNSTTAPRGAVALAATMDTAATGQRLETTRVLKNTYALLSMTLLFSAGVAAAGVALRLPAPGLILTLAGYFGLLFAVHRLRNSIWSLPAVFALTGFMGYTLGPVLSQTLSLPGGAQTITLALGATGATFLALSVYALTTRRDFSFMGGFLFAGMITAVLLAVAAYFLQMPGLALAVSGLIALLSAGLILFETSRIVNGGETNYVTATLSVYLSVYNVFSNLLMLLGVIGGDRD